MIFKGLSKEISKLNKWGIEKKIATPLI